MNRIITCETCKMQRNIETSLNCPICLKEEFINNLIDNQNNLNVGGVGNLIKAVIRHVFTIIDAPAAILGSCPNPRKKKGEYVLWYRNYKNWLSKIIDWASESDNNFWLYSFEEFFGYNKEKIADLLIKKAQKKLLEINDVQ